jgi:ArsR family transcriptional regulator, arsenate/arsenite/antimonite-responsive transcriptional repressor
MSKSTDPDVRLLAALADPARLAIVRQLASDGSVCACDFSACADLAQPTVSHHLRVLREAGLVHGERRGTWIYYRLDPGIADRLAAIAGELGGKGAGRPASALGGAARGDRTIPAVEAVVPVPPGSRG